MTITSKEVAHIASLSRLGLTTKEIEHAAQNISNILDRFASIQNINTDNIPTYDNATGLTNVTRSDQAQAEIHCTCAALLEAAPEVLQGHVKVQAVFGISQTPKAKA